jgi:hypothetical protein
MLAAGRVGRSSVCSGLIEVDLRGQRVVLTLVVDGVDDEDETVQWVSDAGIFIPSSKVVAQLSLMTTG